MCRVLIFAGTTEGVVLASLLAHNRVSVYVSVATEYGCCSYPQSQYLQVHAKRLDTEGMQALIRDLKPELVLDATHPYAAEVTGNIRTACEREGCFRQRVLRDAGRNAKGAVYVENTAAAVDFLGKTQGNILLTTGSKELAEYTALADYQERLYARVLSLPSVVKSCADLGFSGKHLIAMQGPFSKELNESMLRQFNCRYLVTKDGGKAGGFQEKMDAAFSCKAVPVVIGRPPETDGIPLAEAKKMLAEQFGFALKPHVTLLGIGMGNEKTLTVEGKCALETADLLIGARRVADAVKRPGQDVLYEYRSEQLVQYIREHPEYENIVVALSGDVGFYSGAKKLLELLGNNTEVICGISSVVYFMSRIGLAWEDAKLVSAHGRSCNLVSLIRQNKKVFALLGTGNGISVLAKKLTDYGMGHVILYAGENLSEKNEKIFYKRADKLTDYAGEALSVVCAWNPGASGLCMTHGIEDGQFVRGKAPMTKNEVRTVSLSKLALMEDSVCYDIGAGTGSVAVEMALRAHQGRVFAIEKKEEAADLIEENKRRFAADNLTVVRGTAPEALRALPVPTHVFIGGSSGNLSEILKEVLGKNTEARIVINCITLETVTETMQAAETFAFEKSEIVQLTAARAKQAGRYHMMMGENPIYIITCQYPQNTESFCVSNDDARAKSPNISECRLNDPPQYEHKSWMNIPRYANVRQDCSVCDEAEGGL